MRIGLLGASRVAAYAVIAPARALDGIDVVAVAARDGERARVYAQRHGIPRAYGDYRMLLADPEVDLVYVGTPPSVHAEQALAAVEAGKPVLVEKPFATTSADARRVHDAAASAGVPVFEAMHSPHHRLFERVLEIVRSGEIGSLQAIDASFAAPIDAGDPVRWTPELGGGALMDLGVYPLAWVRRIAGEEFTVAACEGEFRHGVDAGFAAQLDYEGGPACRVSASMTEAKPAARLRIEGDRGTILVVNPVAPQLGHALIVSTAAGERTEQADGPSSYEAQLMAIRATLRDGARFPAAPDDYVRSMEAIERVRMALFAGAAQ